MILGQSDLPATTNTEIFECGAGKKAWVAVNFCCRAGAANVRLAHTSGGTPGDADWIEYDVPLAVGGPPLLREGIRLEDGEKLYAWASAEDVSVNVYGKEEDI